MVNMDFNDTGYTIKKVQFLIHNLMNIKLLTISLTLPQYSVLKVLERNEPITGARLAKESFVTPQTMHTLLVSMQGRNLIQRSAVTGNNKSLNISITHHGMTMLNNAEQVLGDVIKKGNQVLNREEHTQLMDLLVKLYDGLSE
jgi:DNA-binding MarR family transcriptional regulator